MPVIPKDYKYLTEIEFYEEILEIEHMLLSLSNCLAKAMDGNKLAAQQARVISTKLGGRLKSFRRNSTKYLPYGRKTITIPNVMPRRSFKRV